MERLRHPLLAAALGGFLCALLASPRVRAAAAAAPSSAEEKARSLVEEGEFDQALRTINEALTGPDNTDALNARLYVLQGTAYLYLGKEDKATRSFELLLQSMPDFELAKGTSQKIRTLFEKVKTETEKRRVKVTCPPLEDVRAGDRLDVTARVANLPSGAKARLFYRRVGTEAYSSAGFTREGTGQDYVAHVPAFELPEESAGSELEYYLEATDGTGRRLAGVGDGLNPLHARVVAAAGPGPGPTTAVDDDAWYKKWWVWAIVGGVAVGAGAAVAVPLLTNKEARIPVTVRIQQ